MPPFRTRGTNDVCHMSVRPGIQAAQGADSHGYCPQNRLTCANQQAGPHFAAPAASSRAGGVPVMDESHAFHAGGRPARWDWRARRRRLSAAEPGLAEQPAARELEVLRLLAPDPARAAGPGLHLRARARWHKIPPRCALPGDDHRGGNL